jgi:hypothetical protein
MGASDVRLIILFTCRSRGTTRTAIVAINPEPKAATPPVPGGLAATARNCRRYMMQATTQRSVQETIRVEGGQLIDRVKELIHQGNVRRIAIKQGERTVIELPLTVGVIGTALAPELAAIGAIAALITDCTIEIERRDESPTAQGPTAEAKVMDES